jgi:hypothetical protein
MKKILGLTTGELAGDCTKIYYYYYYYHHHHHYTFLITPSGLFSIIINLELRNLDSW